MREGYRFGKEGSGRPKNIQATKAVLLAHGGFGADVKYRSLLDPKLTEIFKTTNQPGATSEMWKEAARIGGMMIQSDWIQCTPWNNPLEKAWATPGTSASTLPARQVFGLIQKANASLTKMLTERFVPMPSLLNKAKASKAVAVANKAATASLEGRRPGFMDKALKDNLIKQYDSLDALAADWKMPADTLKAKVLLS